ncbi:glycosyltransferase [Mariprofundus ferrooxydans]|nr:glycosyltransferase [Mariprofundus ferrooxydans]
MSLDPVTGGGTVERIRQLHAAMRDIEGVSSRILSVAVGEVETGLKDTVLLSCWSRRWYLPAPKLVTMCRMVRQADVIHLMNHWTFINAIIYWLARLTRTPYIICPAGALPLFGRSQGFKRWYNRLVGAALVRNCTAAIAIAEDEALVLQEYGVTQERIFHIPNGVREQDFSFSDAGLFRQQLAIGGVEYLLFVGRLNQIKGPDLLLQAFVSIADHFPHLHLVFAGPDGGMLDSLAQAAAKAGLADRIHFVGYTGGELKSSAYHGASLLVVPSRQEAMSIVALEGAICGVPVVLTDCCGFDQLHDAGAARLTAASEQSLAEEICVLMSDAELRQKMGLAGRHFAQEHYTWDIAVDRYIEICREMVA